MTGINADAGRRSSSSANSCSSSASPRRTSARRRSDSPSSRYGSNCCAGWRRLAGHQIGAIVILDNPELNETFNPDKLAARTPAEVEAGRGTVIRDYGDLVDLLEKIMDFDDHQLHREWFGETTAGTRQTFLRRLVKLRRRIGPLIWCRVEPVHLAEKRVHMVDISRLHKDAQGFVVGALLDRVWREKQGTGRQP